MTHLVYPGALNTRFHHALGAMHLMGLALEVLRNKGHYISEEEEEAATIAILLHDIGHGPFSHALEHTLVPGIRHEDISLLMMEKLNEAFGGRLTKAIQIFQGNYPRKFFCQLISGQVDLDRMDYLNRDSYYTGVSEGVIGFDRIIKMFNLVDDQLVVEEKGIYSIEKFLIARRLMYWQVYLHKTVVAGEQLLVKILERAKELSLQHKSLFATPALKHFLVNDIDGTTFFENDLHLARFAKLDDQDIYTAIKVWADNDDLILSKLCRMLVSRSLYKIEMSNDAPDKQRVERLAFQTAVALDIDEDEVAYFVFTDTLKNRAYNTESSNVNILMKDGSLLDITKASDLSNLESLDKTVKKHILCYVREV